jgi:ABC-2 type transport system permease protein
MSTTALAKTTWVELKMFLREPGAAFFTLVLPVLLLVFNGSTAGNEPQEAFGGAGVIDVLVPGYIALVIATLGLTNVPSLLATYRERGVLRRLQATPVRPWTILFAQLFVQSLVATVGLIVLVTLGMTAFGLRAPQAPAAVLIAYIVSVLGFTAFGFVLAAIIPTARSASAISFALYLPMIFVSGSVMPREALPDWAHRLGDFLPLTYVVESLKQPWISGSWHVAALGLLAAMVVAGTALSSRLFRWA